MKHKLNKDIQDELQDISPLLAKMRKEEDGFSVPEDYFDYLSNSVLEQIKLEPKSSITKKEKVRSPWFAFLIKPRFAISLTTVTLILGVVFWNNFQMGINNQLTEISSQEIESYVASNLEEFETELFMNETLIEELGEIQIEGELIDEYIETVIDEIDEETLEQLL